MKSSLFVTAECRKLGFEQLDAAFLWETMPNSFGGKRFYNLELAMKYILPVH